MYFKCKVSLILQSHLRRGRRKKNSVGNIWHFHNFESFCRNKDLFSFHPAGASRSGAGWDSKESRKINDSSFFTKKCKSWWCFWNTLHICHVITRMRFKPDPQNNLFFLNTILKSNKPTINTICTENANLSA